MPALSGIGSGYALGTYCKKWHGPCLSIDPKVVLVPSQVCRYEGSEAIDNIDFDPNVATDGLT
jgi:hypothetical protein